MATDMAETRWPMGLGIRAGKALLRAENALSRIQATAIGSDFDCIRGLRDARCELNKLAKDISRLVDHLEARQYGEG